MPNLNLNSGVNSPGGGQGFKKDSLGDTNLIDPKADKNNLRMNNNLNLPRGANTLPNQNFRPGGNAKGGNAYQKGNKATPY